MLKSLSSAVVAAVALAAVSWTHTALAINDSGARGSNRLNQTVFIVNDIYTYKNDSKGRRTDETVSVVPFDGECTWVGLSSTEEAHALDCRNGKASPLAGAYFRIYFNKSHRNVCRRGSTIYECTAGCQPSRVPKVLVEEPYEC